MRHSALLACFALSLVALRPVAAYAQTCSGLYEVANGVLRAYSAYDASTKGGKPDPQLRKIMSARTNELLQYATAYFRAADGINVDSDALISQCDNDTRIAVYKAYVEMVIFLARTNGFVSRTVLDDSADMLHRLMLVLQKSNRQDGDLASLDEQLKRYYGRQHLSLPQSLLDVDGDVNQYSTRPNHQACISPDVEVTVTDPVQPVFPASARDLGLGAVSVEVTVTVGPGGDVIGATVSKSSSNMAVDQAALLAARTSKYSPKIANCQPTTGDYLFRADFQPD